MENLSPKNQTSVNSLTTDKHRFKAFDKDSENELTTYRLADIRKECDNFFGSNKAATDIWIRSCALKDYDGNIYEKSPVETFRRLARELSRIEKNYPNPMDTDEITALLGDFKYVILGTTCMRHIGSPFQICTLSDSYVIGNPPNTDSYGGIMKIDEEQVQLMKRGAGVSHDLSSIRPKGSPVKNSALNSTGIVPFAHRYANACREFSKEAKVGRVGISVDIQHPDVPELVKEQFVKLNIPVIKTSFRIDRNAMNSINTGIPFSKRFPDNNTPKTSKESSLVPDNWSNLMDAVWSGSEPGILFWDTILTESIPDCYSTEGFDSITTDINHGAALSKYEGLSQLVLNLFSYVSNPFEENASFDFGLFGIHIQKAVRIADDLIDLNLEKIDRIIEKIQNDPEPAALKRTELNLWKKIREKIYAGRRTAIGLIGEADTMAAIHLSYGDDNAIDFIELVHKQLFLEGFRASALLAKERGAFPVFEYVKEVNNPIIERIRNEDANILSDLKEFGRRNIGIVNFGPSGSAAILAETSPGYDPVYKPYYTRKVVNKNTSNNIDSTEIEDKDAFEEVIELHPKIKLWMKTQQIKPDEILEQGKEVLLKLIESSPYKGVFANQLDWGKQLRMISIIQKWTDQSAGGTLTVPESTSIETISQIYLSAYESGCKNISVFRENAFSQVLLKKLDSKNRVIPPRPKVLEADVIRFMNKSEKWIAFVGLNEGKPYEIFTGLDEMEHFPLPPSVKKGEIIKWKDENGTNNYDFQYVDRHGYKNLIGGLHRLFDAAYWNYAKLISGVLRHKMPLVNVVQLVSSLSLDFEFINSWTKGVKRALEQYIEDDTEFEGSCENCGSTNIAYQEGCPKCKDCGFGQC